VTYSIVARDSNTGCLGVAVQSHYFGVGRVVPWGEAGVGVVATQSFVDVSYGPKGLALLAQGIPPVTALAQLLSLDEGSGRRQVSIMDATGQVATHTGSACIAAAGHSIGDGVSAQANLVESEIVWSAMVEAFTSSTDQFVRRLMAALIAAESVGGDIRGKQSCAILIVGGVATGKLSDDCLFDLRVDDSTDPLGEMSRLIDNSQALGGLVALLEKKGLLVGEFTASKDDVDAALDQLASAQAVLGGQNREPLVWRGLLLGRAGRDAEAAESFAHATEINSRVPLLIRRLAASGMWIRSISELELLLEPAIKVSNFSDCMSRKDEQ